MAFIDVEDLEGEISVIAFPKTFNIYRGEIFEDNIISVSGRVSVKDDEVTIMATKITKFENHNYELLSAINNGNKIIELIIPKGKTDAELKELREYIKNISNQRGNINVKMINCDAQKTIMMYVNEKIYDDLQNMVGKDNIKIAQI